MFKQYLNKFVAKLTHMRRKEIINKNVIENIAYSVMAGLLPGSEFEHQSHYYIHFRTHTLQKGMNCSICPAMC